MHYIARDGLPHGDVYRAVRAGADRRLDRAVEGDDRGSAPEAGPAAAALYRRTAARISADVEAEVDGVGGQLAPETMGKPAARHSGKPSTRRRTLKPRARNAATASKESTQYGP